MTTSVDASPDSTSLEAAQANVLAGTKAQCAQLNSNLKSIYLTAFNNWKISVDAGRIDNTNPPKPPKSYVPVEAPLDAEGLGAKGWFFPEQAGPPVCDVPALPESMVSPKPPLDGAVTNIGQRNGFTSFYSCPNSDTNPPGTLKQIPFPDGTVHKFYLIGTPFGRVWEDQGAIGS
jgi:hypothetical protein